MSKWKAPAIVILFACLGVAGVAQTPRPGIECGCDAVGQYKPPEVYDIQWNRTSSPNNVYQVSVDGFQDKITLTIASDGKAVLSLPGLPLSTNWGFSPDDDRLVVHFRGIGEEHHCHLYDLESGGSDPRWTNIMTVGDSRTIFSPHGCYVVYIGLTAGPRTHIFVVNATTGDVAHQTSFIFATYPGQQGDRFGVAGWGFSPDSQDATFLYAYTTEQGVTWNAVNLTTGSLVVQNFTVASPALWRFSPCGDVIGFARMPVMGPPEVWLIATLDGRQLAWSRLTDSPFRRFYSDQDSHHAVAGGTDYRLAENTASRPCHEGDTDPPYWPATSKLSAKNVGPTSLTLTWGEAKDDDSGLATYRISMVSPESRILGSVSVEDARSFSVTGLTPSTEYTFKVEAGDLAGNWSAEALSVTVTTAAPPSGPTWPIGSQLTVSNVEETGLTLTWTAAVDDKGVTAYRIYRDGEVIATVQGDVLTYDVTGLIADKCYNFRVEAGDADNNWTFLGLAALVCTPDKSAPTWPKGSKLWAEEVTQSSINLNWTDAVDNVGVTKYQVYLVKDGELLLLGPDPRPFEVSCLTPNTAFTFKVEAGDDAGNWSKDGPSARISTAWGDPDCPVLTERVSVSSTGQQAEGTFFQGCCGNICIDPSDFWERYGRADSEDPAISADGRFVAFASIAVNLVPGDTNTHRVRCVTDGTTMLDQFWQHDIFVRDRLTQTTQRVSISTGGEEANGGCYTPAISGDGRYVTFASVATNPVEGDTNGRRDIFVHDRLTGQTERVSLSSTGEQANDHSGGRGPDTRSPISADGRYVAFVSAASNLVPEDTNGMADIFLRDRQTGETKRVSVSSAGEQANAGSWGAALSADGRYVAFASWADNLVPDDTNRKSDIFVHDTQTGQTTRVSVSSEGEQANGDSAGGRYWMDMPTAVSISADGRWVAFDSVAGNLVPGDVDGLADVFVHDRQTGETFMVSSQPASPGSEPSISGDGRFVAFTEGTAGMVRVYDRSTGTMETPGACGCGAQTLLPNYGSYTPAISADGKFVAFASPSTNIVLNMGDTNASDDIFVYQVRGGDEDSDGDGASDVEEQGPDGQNPWYDGNDDAVADRRQSNVASLHTADGQNYVTLAADDGVRMSSVRAVNNPSPGDAPPGVVFPLGFFEFTLSDLPPHGAVSVRLYLPEDAPVNAYYKYGPTPEAPSPHWYEFPFDRENGPGIAEGPIVLHLVDGQRGDADIAQNAVIVEPGAPAFDETIPMAALSLSPLSLEFGPTTTEASLTISNTGDATLYWSVTPDLPAWLSVSPMSGQTSPRSDFFASVTVDRQGLTPGTYNHTISVTSNGGRGSVSVAMEIPFAVAKLRTPSLWCMTISWRSQSGARYRVQFKDDLTDPQWLDLSEEIVATGSSSEWMHCGAGLRRQGFYRVRRIE